jgi:DNA repair photolyase
LSNFLEEQSYLKFFETAALQINEQEIRVKETRCSSLLHAMNYGGRRSSADEYTINLYKGCTHNCSYCYAPSLVHDERAWGSYVDAKINAPLVLEKELREIPEKKVVFISSASDPYQPVEARYKLTRRCLQILQRHNFPVLVLTRSPFILRDLDILRKFEWVRVGFSISSMSGEFFEPGVPKLEARISALRKLNEEDIKTWVSLAPVAPQIQLTNFKWLFRRLRDAGISAISVGMLRFTGYEASRVMFEERTGVDSGNALANGAEVIAEIKQLAESAELDTSCRSLLFQEGEISVGSAAMDLFLC